MTETMEIGTRDVARVAPIPQGGDVLAVYESRLDAVPDAGGDGIEGILAVIAASDSVDGLDAAWQTSGLSRFVDVPIMVTDIAKLPAQYDDSPIPWYLVVHGAIIETGEAFTATTGSVAVVAQLAQAFHIGALPWACVVKARESRTRKGAIIQHLESVR